MGQATKVGALVTAVALSAAGALGFADVAGADTGAPYTLKASGVALKVAVAGTTVVGGTSSATASNGGAASAEGAGVLTPAVVSDQKATAASAGTSQTLPQQCAQPTTAFPAPIGTLLTLGLGCSTASASQDANGLPTASATGQVAGLTIGVPSATALPLPVSPGSAVATALQTVLGNLPALPSTGLPLPTVLNQVAAAAGTSLSSLLDVKVGPSTSSATATATTATATTQDEGAQIDVADGLGGGGGPLLSVVVGKADTTAALDRATGEVTTTDTPAVVSVTLDPPVGSPQTVNIAPGVSESFLTGTPLATTIAAGSASASPGTGNGSVSADGVTVNTLKGVGAGSTGTDGGIDLQIASASTDGSGTAPVATAAAPVTPPPTPVAPAAVPAAAPTVPGVTTVHTGEFWSGPLPIALVGLAILTGLGLIARRRLLGLTHHLTNLARFTHSSAGDLPPGPASGTSSVPPPVSGPARRQTH